MIIIGFFDCIAYWRPDTCVQLALFYACYSIIQSMKSARPFPAAEQRSAISKWNSISRQKTAAALSSCLTLEDETVGWHLKNCAVISKIVPVEFSNFLINFLLRVCAVTVQLTTYFWTAFSAVCFKNESSYFEHLLEILFGQLGWQMEKLLRIRLGNKLGICTEY